MRAQPFPNLQCPMTDVRGNLSPVWRAFLAEIWHRTGGNLPAQFAPVNGDASQVFNAAPAQTVTETVPLGQAETLFAAIGGIGTQAFAVAPATIDNEAVPLGQAQKNFAALAGSATQAFAVATATASDQAVSLGQFGSGAGYATLPGGLKVQWGTATTGSAGSVAITFPVPFVSVVGAVMVNTQAEPGGTTSVVGSAYPISLTDCTISIINSSGAGVSGWGAQWFAIGV